MNLSAIVWLILMVLFILAEASTVALVSLWFAVGCLAAVIISLFGGTVGWQIAAFLVVSSLLLLLLRPMLRKFFNPRLNPTNADAVIGSEGYVTEAIDNTKATGRVKLGAMSWTARSTSGRPIPADTLVRADRIEGVKVFVSPAEKA